MRRELVGLVTVASLFAGPVLAQTVMPKSAPNIPAPSIVPTLPMTAPAAPTLTPIQAAPAPSAPQVVLPPMSPPPAVAVPAPAAPAPAAAQLPTPAPRAVQTPPAAAPAVFPAAAAKTAASPTPAPTATAKAKTAAPHGKSCTRLPLSDIQFGRENTIKVARDKLEDYAQKVAKEKGWKNGYTRSNETATCEDYLWLPIGGQEYKCLVTATFCAE